MGSIIFIGCLAKGEKVRSAADPSRRYRELPRHRSEQTDTSQIGGWLYAACNMEYGDSLVKLFWVWFSAVEFSAEIWNKELIAGEPLNSQSTVPKLQA
jgi:hypothetical protein